MLGKFKRMFSEILNDHFDSIPIHIHIVFDGCKYIITIDECEDGCQLCFNKDKSFSKECDSSWITDDLKYLCYKFIDKYNKDNNIVVEDGECCAGGGETAAAADTTGSVGGGDSVPTPIDTPEINSTNVGGLYVTYVCPGALPYFKFRRSLKKHKNKK